MAPTGGVSDTARPRHASPSNSRNRQYTHSHRAALLLSPEQLAELAAAVRGPAPEGDAWLGRTVAAWVRQRLTVVGLLLQAHK